MSPTIACPYRQNIRQQGEQETAECRLLHEISGAVLERPFEVPRKACEACPQQTPSSNRRFHPVIASLLHQMCEEILAQDGAAGCTAEQARRLQQRAYKSLALESAPAPSLVFRRGAHKTLCPSHAAEPDRPPEICIHLTRPYGDLIGQGVHRSGWPYAIRSLQPLFCNHGVLFDDFIEQRFCYAPQPLVYTQPWVGVFHHPPTTPAFLGDDHGMAEILATSAWWESSKHLRGAIAFSEYLGGFLRQHLDVPVEVVKLPSEIPQQQWSETAYLQAPRKKLAQTGWYLRNTRAIYQTPDLPEYEKWRSASPAAWTTEYDRGVSEYWARRGDRREYGSVTEDEYLSDDQYDQLLSSCVVLTELFEASANNVIVECIARNTPILINRHPAAVEYLTPDYPLFFEDLEQAPELLAPERVIAAHRFLKGMKKDWLSGEYFCRSIANALKKMDLGEKSANSRLGT